VILLNEGKLLFSGTPKKMTERVRCRTLAFAASDGRRKILARALQHDSVIDEVIQGERIRLVLRDDHGQFDPRSIGAADADIIAVEPRFEDAFIDMLGGRERGICTGKSHEADSDR
jgi:ABC-2 type transport system ATP-binding protein